MSLESSAETGAFVQRRPERMQIVRLAWPMFIAQLAILTNGIIDTAMSGRLSTLDLAAVGIGTSILATVFMSLLGVLLALPPLVAHLYGAGQHAAIGREIHQSVWVSLIIGLIAILLLRHPEPFIAITQMLPAVELKVRAYLEASAWGVPATIALRLYSGFSMGIGRPRSVMIFNLLALLLKLPLNAIFMYGLIGVPTLGAPGCAVATAIATTLVALLAWGWCLSQPAYAPFQLRARLAAPDRAAIASFLRLGIPIGLTFFADVTAFTLMALFIARLGPIASGAQQIAANLAVIAYMIPLSLGNALAVLAGQYLGAGEPERARQICWTGIRLGLSVASIVSIGLWIGAPWIAALYSPDIHVQAAATPLILLVGFYHLADALQALAVNALRGYRKSAVPMLIYTTSLWGIGLGGGVLLGLTDTFGPARGAAGFWLAASVSLGLVSVQVALYLNIVSRMNERPTPQSVARFSS